MRVARLEAWKVRSKPPSSAFRSRPEETQVEVLYLGEGLPRDDAKSVHIRFTWSPSEHRLVWFRTTREAYAERKKLRQQGWRVRVRKSR